MSKDDGEEPMERTCPNCGSDAFYRYGRTKHGKQRYQCLLCGRQFIVDRERAVIRDKPACPACGGRMHLYKREKNDLRFRCANYPHCRHYLKVSMGACQSGQMNHSGEDNGTPSRKTPHS